MSERTIIAVVTDLRKSGLTVEQQILVDELIMLAMALQARGDANEMAWQLEAERIEAQREVWRAQKRVQRKSKEVRRTKESPPHPQKKTKNINNNITPLTPLAEPLFDEFWGVYPAKVGKGAARKAYRHALTRGSSAEILAGAKRYAESKPDPKFTKHPSTWLNAECWLDEGHKVLPFERSGPKWMDVKSEYVERYGAEALKRYNEDLAKKVIS
jgi:hypothetical protein